MNIFIDRSNDMTLFIERTYSRLSPTMTSTRCGHLWRNSCLSAWNLKTGCYECIEHKRHCIWQLKSFSLALMVLFSLHFFMFYENHIEPALTTTASSRHPALKATPYWLPCVFLIHTFVMSKITTSSTRPEPIKNTPKTAASSFSFTICSVAWSEIHSLFLTSHPTNSLIQQDWS